MKLKLVFLILILSQVQLFAADIIISNTGSVKTLEEAYNYINLNYTNGSNQVNTPVNIYLMNDGGDINVSGTSNSLLWSISGTATNPITITSYSCYATLTRNIDIDAHMLILRGANFIKISKIDFNRVTQGAILIDDGDNNTISYCSFHGDGYSVTPRSTGIIWIGVDFNYTGQNTRNSYNNTVSNNNFYNMHVIGESNQHHAIYISNGAHNNQVFNNYINYPPAYGIHGEHGDYRYNQISTNLISRRYMIDNKGVTGIVLSSQFDHNNGAPGSIFGNYCVGNYTYDDENSGDGVTIVATLSSTNGKSNNRRFNDLRPNDPYWLGYGADKITDRMVTGDFDRDGVEDDIAAFYDYGSDHTKIHIWKSTTGSAFEYLSGDGWWSGTTYTAANISKRVVNGDFDSDGFKDDIAVFYDYGNNVTGINVWKSNGNGFDTPATWWTATGYTAGKISGRIVSGDFDRDGVEDDIAAFYDYGGGQTRIHVWIGTGSGFNYQSSTGWWSASSGYDATKITDKVVSGDFDRDGVEDDIAVLYDYGNTETRIHVWKSTGGAFDYSGSTGWWANSTYDATKILNRVVSGDFDRDGLNDDIAAFYDGGNDQIKLHVWTSSQTAFQYSGASGWWNASGYTPSKISGRILAGDFDRDGKKDDITAFYDYSSNCGNVRSHVWQSGGNNFAYYNESLGYPWLTGYSYYLKGGNLTAGIDEESSLSTIKSNSPDIYPNPADEFVIFDVKNTSAQLKIWDSHGKQVFNQSINDTYRLETKNYPAGIYLYTIVFENEIVNGKLVME